MKTIWAGHYECEGHIVHFQVNDDETVKVTEIFNDATMPCLNINIDEAVTKQQYLERLGYTRW